MIRTDGPQVQRVSTRTTGPNSAGYTLKCATLKLLAGSFSARIETGKARTIKRLTPSLKVFSN